MESGDFVLPGVELGFSEEFLASKGTYEEEGKIYSAVTGTLDVDTDNREMRVETRTSKIPEPQEGDVVIGRVVDVKQQFAPVKLIRLIGVPRKLPGSFYGTIHISKVKTSYVQDLSREISAGDIVRAKVINTRRQPLSLSTEDKDMGVIKGYCSRCNVALKLEKNRLRCPKCDKVESRKYALDFGKGNV